MKKIKSIKIVHRNWGLMLGSNISKCQTNINVSGAVRYSLYTGESKRAVQTYKYKSDKEVVREFCAFIEPIIMEWDSDYSVPVCDGFMWEVIIKYTDNTVKRVNGTVNPPPRGADIELRIKDLVAYEVEPIIF